MIKSGDAYANKIYEEYGGAAMTPFPQLSNADIDNILAYTATEAAPPPAPTPGAETGTAQVEGGISFLIEIVNSNVKLNIDNVVVKKTP